MRNHPPACVPTCARLSVGAARGRLAQLPCMSVTLNLVSESVSLLTRPINSKFRGDAVANTTMHASVLVQGGGQVAKCDSARAQAAQGEVLHTVVRVSLRATGMLIRRADVCASMLNVSQLEAGLVQFLRRYQKVGCITCRLGL